MRSEWESYPFLFIFCTTNTSPQTLDLKTSTVSGCRVWPESNPVTTAEEVGAADVPFDPMCSFNMWGIYGAAKPLTRSPYPSAITWLSSRGLTGGTVHLPPLHLPHTHSSFSDFSLHDLYYLTPHTLHAPRYLVKHTLFEAHWVPPNWICCDAKCLAQGQLDNSRWRMAKNVTHSARGIDSTEVSRDYKNRHTLGSWTSFRFWTGLNWSALLL